jgi:glucosylceramidase
MRRIERLAIVGVLVGVGACGSQGAPPGASRDGAGGAGSAGSAGSNANQAAGASAAGASSTSAGAVGSNGGAHVDLGNGGVRDEGLAGAGASAAGGPPLLPVLITSGPRAYWQTDGELHDASSEVADVTIDDGAVAQLWQGFGGTFSERAADAFSQLSTEDRDTALKLLFGRDGLGFDYGRIPIGASDYAIDRYSLDETAGDFEMSQFSIERDKQKLIPYIKAVLAVAPQVHLWASPWSPPTWMKDSAGFDGGNMKEDDATLHAFALYLTRFVQEYGKLGISIEVIHPQKEPNLALDFPSCVWSPAAMTKLIGRHLGPMFEEQKVGAQIFLGSLSEDDHAGKSLALISAVTSDPTGMSYVKGFGFEWQGLNLVAAVRDKHLPIWQDNHNVGNLPWDGSGANSEFAPNNHAYATASWGFIREWVEAGVGAYFTSNMILDAVGIGIGANAWPQNALLVVDSSKKLVVTPAYYLFRHVAGFVEPGAHVIGATGTDTLAFKNPDGTIVAVLYNSGPLKQTVLAIGQKKLKFELPENGFATVVSK